MITRLLVANRGEIARRVFATCRRLGIETVAVHSDADAGLPFVREADYAVRLRGNTPAETHLRGDLVVEAARHAGADGVHPGYGFLSENAGFARAVIEAGLTWVGPSPESIEQMGSKVASKALMESAGVPVLPNLTPDSATEADLPLLVKASAGGGGRGMRVVRSLAELPGEVEAAGAEALSAFGDATVFVEPYVERGRHVEVQVWGDATAHVTVLGDRDCSVQRRHQKVVEEAPAPGLSPELVEQLHEAARAAAEAIDYVGAGTVEFLYDPARKAFWFLEMNTRLQVEHPVTEAVTGLDLVELQLRAAAPPEDGGRSTPWSGEPDGHAIEVRLYAEDPAADYQPQSGRLSTFEIEHDTTFGWAPGAGLRLDAGFESGSEVSTHYDAMLAKLVCHAPTREAAIRRLVAALRRARLHGLRTNRDLLVATLTDPAFVAGDVSTSLLTDSDLPGRPSSADVGAALLAATAASVADLAARRTVQRGVPTGWRNVVSQPQVARFVVDGVDQPEGVEWLAGHHLPVFPSADFDVRGIVREDGGYRVDFTWEGLGSHARVVFDESRLPGSREVYVDGPLGSLHLSEHPRFVDPADVVAQGSLLAPMPGTVIGTPVEVGATVTAGQTVLVLEAMKMQHSIKAPTDGVLTELAVATGQQVAAGDVLAVVEPVEPVEPGSPNSEETNT